MTSQERNTLGRPSASTCSEPRNASAKATMSGKSPPSGSAEQMAWRTSRRPKVDAFAVNPSALANTANSSSAPAVPATGTRTSRPVPTSAAMASASKPSPSARRRHSGSRPSAAGLPVLGLAGRAGRLLRGGRTAVAPLVELGLDLGAAAREPAQRRRRDAGDLGDALADRAPLDAQPPRQLRQQLGLVQEPR